MDDEHKRSGVVCHTHTHTYTRARNIYLYLYLPADSIAPANCDGGIDSGTNGYHPANDCALLHNVSIKKIM